MKYWRNNIFLSLFINFACVLSKTTRERCLMSSEYQDKRSLIVTTVNGDILGQKETQVDQRWNKTVTWTSYFVGLFK